MHRAVSYNEAGAANASVAAGRFFPELQELHGCQSLERLQTSALGVFWKSALKKCILLINYSNGLVSCTENLHAVLLGEKKKKKI